MSQHDRRERRETRGSQRGPHAHFGLCEKRKTSPLNRGHCHQTRWRWVRCNPLVWGIRSIGVETFHDAPFARSIP